MKSSNLFLKNRRLALGLTMLQVADAVGVSEATVSRWESGNIANMKRDKIAALAKILLVSPSQIMDTEGGECVGESEGYPNTFPLKMKKIPLLGKTACGDPIFDPHESGDYVLIGEGMDADFALEARGDSMIGAGIADGDIVYFQAQNMVDHGQIAAVFIDDEVTLKRVYYYREKNKLVLQPDNPAYEPLVYMNEELDSIRIVGKAVAHLRKL